MNKNLESLKLTKENIKTIKGAVKNLFNITEEDLEYRKFFIEIKEPTKPEDIVVCNDYRDSECAGMLDGKKYVTFYFCNKDFTTIEDEDTIHVQIIDEHAYYDESGNLLTGYDEDEDYMIDRYSNKYNVDLSDAIFVVLYEVFDFNEIGDYVAEIYPLI